jgi:hypothetical protein
MKSRSDCGVDAQKSIQFGLLLPAFPFLICVVPLTAYAALFAVYYMEGRFANYLPSISEIARETANLQIAVVGFRAVELFTRVIIACYVISAFKVDFRLRPLLKLVFCSGFASFIAMHYIPARIGSVRFSAAEAISIGSTIISHFLLFMVSADRHTIVKSATRLLFVLIQILAVLGWMWNGKLVDIRSQATVGALGEYVYTLITSLFYLTFVPELSDVDMIGIIP